MWARASAFLEQYVGGLTEQNSLLAMEQRQQQLAEELVAAAANGGGGATLEQLLGMESMPLAGAATATSQRFGSTTVALEAPSSSSSSSSAAVARGGKPSGGSLDRIYDASSELTLGTSMTFAGGGSALMRDRRRTKSGKNDKEHASLQQQGTAQPLPERISEEDDGVESLSLLQTLDTLAEAGRTDSRSESRGSSRRRRNNPETTAEQSLPPPLRRRRAAAAAVVAAVNQVSPGNNVRSSNQSPPDTPGGGGGGCTCRLPVPRRRSRRLRSRGWSRDGGAQEAWQGSSIAGKQEPKASRRGGATAPSTRRRAPPTPVQLLGDGESPTAEQRKRNKKKRKKKRQQSSRKRRRRWRGRGRAAVGLRRGRVGQRWR